MIRRVSPWFVTAVYRPLEGCSVPIAGRCTLVVWNGPAPVSGTEMAQHSAGRPTPHTRSMQSSSPLRERILAVRDDGTLRPETTTEMNDNEDESRWGRCSIILVGVGNRIQTHMHGMLHVPCPFVICFCFELDLTTQTNQPTNQQQDPDTIQPRIRVYYSILLEHVSGNVVTRIVKTGTCVCLLWIQ